jgi:TonB family protein
MNDRMTRGAPAHKASGRVPLLLISLLCACFAAQAQTPAAGDGAPSEAARRAAASPYRFILQNASAPARKPAAPVEAKKPAAAPAEPAPVQAAVARPAPAPAAAALAPSPSLATPPERPAAAVATPAPDPEPVTTAAHTRPGEPPVRIRREVIPVRIDEPRLSAVLMREKPNGVVRIQFDINPDGSTGGVKVVTSTNRSLNRATVDAVSAWKFQPVDEVLTVETEVAYKYD